MARKRIPPLICLALLAPVTGCFREPEKRSPTVRQERPSPPVAAQERRAELPAPASFDVDPQAIPARDPKSLAEELASTRRKMAELKAKLIRAARGNAPLSEEELDSALREVQEAILRVERIERVLGEMESPGDRR
ncbi:MAG: hypothetical protein ACE5GW_12690 [Planctomycetota bacterium]